jgi:hypothetical protein
VSRSRARAVAAGIALALSLATRAAFAQTASPTPDPFGTPGGGADCSVVTTEEISQLVGYGVSPPDDSSRASGICFYTSPSLTNAGSASFAVIDEARMQQRRAFYLQLARRCGNVHPGAQVEFECKSFNELARAKTMDEYFAARTDLPNSEPVSGLGDAAIAAGSALYVKRGAVVYEVVVRRGDALDVAQATALAKLLLSRLPAVAEPEPSPSPRRPTPS